MCNKVILIRDRINWSEFEGLEVSWVGWEVIQRGERLWERNGIEKKGRVLEGTYLIILDFLIKMSVEISVEKIEGSVLIKRNAS